MRLFVKPKKIDIKRAASYKISDFESKDEKHAWFKSLYFIDLNYRYCSCSYFLDRGICCHFISYCKMKNLFNNKKDQVFKVKSVGRPKKTNLALKR